MGDPIKMFARPRMDGGVDFTTRIDDSSALTRHAAEAVIVEIVQEVARRYVEENYSTLVAEIDTKAIANLVIAKCADRIASAVTIAPAKVNR